MVNVGQRIREELDRQERSVSWLARKLNVNRASVYRIFNKTSIDSHQLLTISNIMHYNFFEELAKDVSL